MTIAQNVEVGTTAQAAVELLCEFAADLPAEHRPSFWRRVIDFCIKRGNWKPESPEAGRPDPMSNTEARAFGQQPIPFGRFQGQRVDSLTIGYLEYIAEPTPFVVELRRYLASQRVQSEIEAAEQE